MTKRLSQDGRKVLGGQKISSGKRSMTGRWFVSFSGLFFKMKANSFLYLTNISDIFIFKPNFTDFNLMISIDVKLYYLIVYHDIYLFLILFNINLVV